MADLHISLFASVQNGCASGPLGSQTLTTSITSAQGNANAGGASVARLYSEAAHWVTVGSNPTATSTNGFYMPAGQFFDLDLGSITDKIAAITA